MGLESRPSWRTSCRVVDVAITGSNFTGNTAAQQGGAVYAVGSQGQTLVSGARFTNNTAGGGPNHTPCSAFVRGFLVPRIESAFFIVHVER
jgi:Chlamydia polymorphic membrane protein (Chlamydia_PMP) repeat